MRIGLLSLACLSVMAHGAESRGLKPLIVVDADQQPVAEFRSHQALIIGNSRYTAGWPVLEGVRDDVPAIQQALERHGFQVTVAQDVTKAQMIDTVDGFIADKCQDESCRAVVYYAGHGQTLNGIGYLVPVDAPLPEDRAFIRRAIPITSLKTSAMQARSRHVLFAFDACFAGSIFVPLRGANAYVLRAASEPVRMFLTAGSANEQVPDRSFFRFEFIAGINGQADANRDGYVTGSELGSYVKQAVSDRAAAAGMRLTPQAGVSEQEGLNRGDFVFRVAPLDTPSVATAPAPLPAATSVPPIAQVGTGATVPMPTQPGPTIAGLPPSMGTAPGSTGNPAAIPNTPEGTADAYARLVGVYNVPPTSDPDGTYQSYSFEIDPAAKHFLGSDTKAQVSICNNSTRTRSPILMRFTVASLSSDGTTLIVAGVDAQSRSIAVRLTPQPNGDLKWDLGSAQYMVRRRARK